MTETVFTNPPKSNVLIKFGKESNMHIQFYTKQMPNRFQRWMLLKVFGIYMEWI